MTRRVLVQLFDALSDDTRLKIVIMLSKQDADASCQVLRKQFNLSQPAMSHHFKILKQCRVVTTKKYGRHVYYSLNRELLGTYLERFIQDIQNGEVRDE